MKPLLEKELPTLLKRFDNFIDAELRSIEIISPTIIKITLAGQDSSRGFDWITVELEFNDVSDAQLVESSKLSYLDMSDGVSIIFTDNLFAFGIGTYNSSSNIKNSSSFIISASLKYAEGSF